MAKQLDNGKAFEYACLEALYRALKEYGEVSIEPSAPLETAKGKYTEIYVQPFRAYYVGSSAGSKLSMFEIVYDELDENDGLITGITDVRTRGPLSVVTGHGNMMLTSTEDINVTVCNIKGTVVANLKMTAGEQQNINVPAGVYLVNKKKVIVK